MTSESDLILTESDVSQIQTNDYFHISVIWDKMTLAHGAFYVHKLQRNDIICDNDSCRMNL